MKIKFFLLFFLLFAGVFNLRAEVYWLKDIFKRAKRSNQQKYTEKYRESRMQGILRFDSLFSEDISVNGEDGELHVGLLDYTYNEFLFNLRYLELKNFAANASNTVIVFGSRRYLVYNTGEFSKAVCFEFDVPLRKNPPGLPDYIPDPGSGAVHSRIVRFPDRGTTYVTFETVLNAEDAFLNCLNQLSMRNIRRIGGTHDSSTAGFFMNDGGTEIVLISFSQEFNNGFIYHTGKKR